MDWHDLAKKKVAELREMAKEHANVEGTTGLLKEQLVEIVAKALNIEKPHLVVEGLDKLQIKQKIRALKVDVQAAIQAKDRKLVRRKRRQIHRLKRQIHKAAHLTH